MEHKDFSFKKYAWDQFKKNKPALYSLYILLVLVVIAIFAPVIANDQPLYCKYKGETYFPAFVSLVNSSVKVDILDQETGKVEELQFDITDWRRLNLEKVVNTLKAMKEYRPSVADAVKLYLQDNLYLSIQQL